MVDVEFYFYLGCPWTYLAFTRLRESAWRTGARVVWKPVLVDRVRHAATPGGATGHVELSPARARYQAKDLQDWARFCGLVIGRPGPFPAAAGWAARGAVVAIAAGKADPYCELAFRACFEESADLDSLDSVVRIAATAGLEPADFRAACADSGSLAVVERYSDELAARGGFGSPTMFIGEDMYFGNDRMPLVELALSRAAERPLVVPGAHGQR